MISALPYGRVCPKCHRLFKVRNPSILKLGMCAGCAKVWLRPSMQEVVDGLPDETLQAIRTLWWEKSKLETILAVMRKTKPDIGRPWDLGIVGLALARAERKGMKPVIKLRDV